MRRVLAAVAVVCAVMCPVEALAQSVSFECPSEQDTCEDRYGNEACCERGYQLVTDDDGYEMCQFAGLHTVYEEYYDDRGREQTVKVTEGTCTNGSAEGKAKSWSDESGERTETSGNFKRGEPVGVHMEKGPSGIHSVACFDHSSELLWHYGQRPEAERPDKPKRRDYDDSDEFKDAIAEFKELMGDYKADLAEFRRIGGQLAKLTAACPTATNTLCSFAASEDGEATAQTAIENDCESDCVCINGMAVKYTGSVTMTPGCDEEEDDCEIPVGLHTSSTPLGIFEMTCYPANNLASMWYEGADGLWSLQHPVPEAAPHKPNRRDFDNDDDGFEEAQAEYLEALKAHNADMAQFKRFAAVLAKHKGACPQTTDALCALIDREMSEDGDGDETVLEADAYTTEGGGACLERLGLTVAGKLRVHSDDDDVEVVGTGLHTTRSRLGPHSSECYIEIEEEDEESTWETWWSVTLEYPGSAPPAPKRSDYHDDEDFQDARAEHAELLASHKADLARYVSLSKRLERANKGCPEVNDDVCWFVREGGSETVNAVVEMLDEDACDKGYAITQTGRTKRSGGEDYPDGFHASRTRLGVIEGSCHKLSKGERYEDEYGDDVQDYESEEIWTLENESPEPPPLPPIRTDYDTDEEFAEAKREAQAVAATYKEELAIFTAKSKSIEALGRVCPRITATYCKATGECQEDGACRYVEDSCTVASTGHCRQANICKRDGLCTRTAAAVADVARTAIAPPRTVSASWRAPTTASAPSAARRAARATSSASPAVTPVSRARSVVRTVDAPAPRRAAWPRPPRT
ncbi:MAG: hypothetical protein QF464_05990, partial [Myxococcota bacterium]|nr:hypothetical protein [Myxococcota bacterium]